MRVGLLLALMGHFAPPSRLLLLGELFVHIMVAFLRLSLQTWGVVLLLELKCERLSRGFVKQIMLRIIWLTLATPSLTGCICLTL
ncbi:hypothetical protein LINGRAHAP2_LOCUS23369 [Linum grandiflorum]